MHANTAPYLQIDVKGKIGLVASWPDQSMVDRRPSQCWFSLNGLGRHHSVGGCIPALALCNREPIVFHRVLGGDVIKPKGGHWQLCHFSLDATILFAISGRELPEIIYSLLWRSVRFARWQLLREWNFSKLWPIEIINLLSVFFLTITFAQFPVPSI